MDFAVSHVLQVCLPCSAAQSCVFALAASTIVRTVVYKCWLEFDEILLSIVCDNIVICRVQASVASAQQMPVPLPASTITSLHLRPQQDQYNDMAKFLGYSSISSSLPSPHTVRSNQSQASSQAASQAPAPAQSQTAGQALGQPHEAVSHAGLYPNDHAMDLPASRPHHNTSVRDSNQKALQLESSSVSSTSTSSQSSGSSHRHSGRQQAGAPPVRPAIRQAERQSHSRPERQAEGQPQSQPERQAEAQPGRQQHQAPLARVVASPFMADAAHSFLPATVPPTSAFKSPFMADAEHSFVPANDQQGAPSPWETFAPQTSNPQHSASSTRHSPAGHSSDSTGTHASPPTDYFSYLHLLGPQQAVTLPPSPQQPHSTQLPQSTQAQMPHPHRQHRQHRQPQGQDTQHAQHAGRQYATAQHAQHANTQHASAQHAQHAGAQQHRQQHHHGKLHHRQDIDGRQAAHHLQQTQPQQQVRPSRSAHPAGPPQQTPTGSKSGTPLGVNAPTGPPRSAFDSFDTSGEGQLDEMHGCLVTAFLTAGCLLCLVLCECRRFVYCIVLGRRTVDFTVLDNYTIHCIVLGRCNVFCMLCLADALFSAIIFGI